MCSSLDACNVLLQVFTLPYTASDSRSLRETKRLAGTWELGVSIYAAPSLPDSPRRSHPFHHDKATGSPLSRRRATFPWRSMGCLGMLHFSALQGNAERNGKTRHGVQQLNRKQRYCARLALSS